MTEEKMILAHAPVPGDRMIFYVSVAVSFVYLGTLFLIYYY